MRLKIEQLMRGFSSEIIHFSPEYFSYDNEEQKSQFVAALNQRKSIILSGDNAMKEIGYLLKHCNALNELIWTINEIDDYQAKLLAISLKKNRSLKKLTLTLPELNISIKTRALLVEALSSIAELTLRIGEKPFKKEFMKFLSYSRKKQGRAAIYKLDSTEVGELVGILSHTDLYNLSIEVSPEDFLLLLPGLEKNKTLHDLNLNIIPPTDAAIRGLADFLKVNRTINHFNFNFEIRQFCTSSQFQQLWDALERNTKITNLWLDHSSYDDMCHRLTGRNSTIEHQLTRFMERYGVFQQDKLFQVKNYPRLVLGYVDFQWSAQIMEEVLKRGETSLSGIDSHVNGVLLDISREYVDAFQIYVLEAQWLEIKIDLIFQYGTEEEINKFINKCRNLTPKVQAELPSIFYEKLMMHVFALQRYELTIEFYFKFKACQANTSLLNYALKIYLTGDEAVSDIEELYTKLPTKNEINTLSKDVKEAFLNKIIVLQKFITAGQNEANQNNTSLLQIKNYTDSFHEELEEYHSLKYLEKILSSKGLKNTNSTGIKAIQAIVDSDLSFKEKIYQIKAISIEKIKPGFSYWYSHSHFFGKGRDKLVEDIYIHLSALPISLQDNMEDKPSDLLQVIAEFTP